MGRDEGGRGQAGDRCRRDGEDLGPQDRGRRRPAARSHVGRGRGDQAAAGRERRTATGERNPQGGLGFLRGRARPAVEALVAFIDAHRQVFGVEPICRVLTSHGLKIATSTYYAARNRTPSDRSVRDRELKTQISRVHTDNFGVYGARKVWRQLHREGIPVARCTVARLMRDLGLEGARRGKKIRTTVREDGHERSADLLQRDFTASRPNERWVADFTYVATWSGIVYVAFVVDVFSRAIVGWSAATNKRAKLVLDALDMALWRRDRAGTPAGPGLVHHSDAGSQYTSFA
ncbi:IS3 family transposase, partial [Streptomyces sp. SID5477]|nr:IS3 family transposase [Streptomyces sp. SID5477]MZE49156.1 IS3 family transposase [Streptomyces sp. SID5477]